MNLSEALDVVHGHFGWRNADDWPIALVELVDVVDAVAGDCCDFQGQIRD